MVVEWSKACIKFLDATVPFTEGVTETDLFVKPTDSHQYLQATSCLCNMIRRGITY